MFAVLIVKLYVIFGAFIYCQNNFEKVILLSVKTELLLDNRHIKCNSWGKITQFNANYWDLKSCIAFAMSSRWRISSLFSLYCTFPPAHLWPKCPVAALFYKITNNGFAMSWRGCYWGLESEIFVYVFH